MKITYVNYTDLAGKIFNGYDLHCSLNANNHDCFMLVNEKISDIETVIELLNVRTRQVHTLLRELENESGVCNLLFPNAFSICNNPCFQNADIVHYQMIHNRVLSIDDWKYMMQRKGSVWTIHDPWLLTGHCVHPLNCNKWKIGCCFCERFDEEPFYSEIDRASQIWEIKRKILQDINPHIVVTTEFMGRYIIESPLTRHFSNIHKIPFGIDIEKRKPQDKIKARRYLGIPETCYVIAFRSTSEPIKGMNYILDALPRLDVGKQIMLLTVGIETLPDFVRHSYQSVELGWLQKEEDIDRFFSAADVFVMPSLAESFGMMAIEAMAVECPVIVFDGTVLPEITFAPECGICVPYRDSNALGDAITWLMNNPQEGLKRGKLGREIVKTHYKFSDYVAAHINLYQSIIYEMDK